MACGFQVDEFRCVFACVAGGCQSVLCCAVLCCAVLCCAVLCCASEVYWTPNVTANGRGGTRAAQLTFRRDSRSAFSRSIAARVESRFLPGVRPGVFESSPSLHNTQRHTKPTKPTSQADGAAARGRAGGQRTAPHWGRASFKHKLWCWQYTSISRLTRLMPAPTPPSACRRSRSQRRRQDQTSASHPRSVDRHTTTVQRGSTAPAARRGRDTAQATRRA